MIDNYVKVQQDSKDLLKDTLIRGLPRVTGYDIQSIERRHYDEVLHKEVSQREWVIVTHGSNYDKLVEVPAVDFKNCRTSNIYDVYRNLGIQASRRWTEQTLEEAVRACKSNMDTHHTKLIADVMTRTGVITPMTRVGLSNSTDSPCRMMFENVLENVKRFGAFSAKDALRGIPECIMNGILAPVGAGFAKSERLAPDALATFASPAKDAPSAPATAMRSLISFCSALPFASANSKAKKEFTVQNGVRQVPCGHYAFSYFQRFVPVQRNGLLVYGGDRVSSVPKHFMLDPSKGKPKEDTDTSVKRECIAMNKIGGSAFQNHFPPLWRAPDTDCVDTPKLSCSFSSWTSRPAFVDLVRSLVWIH